MTSIDNNPVSQNMDALVALIEAGLHQIDLGQKSIEFQAQQHMIHLATIQDRHMLLGLKFKPSNI